jgi:hypothetical protein
MSSRAGLQDMFTFGEPRSNDAQDIKSYLWDIVGGAPGSLVLDWMEGSQSLMGGDFAKASEKLVPLKFVADMIRTYRTTSEGKKTGAGYERMSPYSLPEAAIRTLGFTPGREAETNEAAGHFYSAQRRSTEARNKMMQDWANASPGERGRLWGQVEKFNYNKTRDERLTRADLEKYTKRRRTEEKGLVKRGFRVDRRSKELFRQVEGTYNQ